MAVSVPARESVTDLAMEARALNIAQARTLVDDREVECMLRELVALHRSPLPMDAREHLQALVALTRELALSNHEEGECEQAIAGAMRRTLHDGSVTRMLGVKALARALREPLRDLARAEGGLDLIHAVRRIDRALADVPSSQLDSPSLRHELGDGPYRLLRQVVEDE